MSSIYMLHLIFGHNWSGWKIRIVNRLAYDEEIWWERTCSCGAVDQRDFTDNVSDDIDSWEK